MFIPKTGYRDQNGNPVTAQEVRQDPDALDKQYQFSLLRAEPEQCDLLGFIGGLPVVHVTDLGESVYTDALREVAYKLPGDDRVYRTGLDADCTLPRHRSGFVTLPLDHPLRGRGYYLVLNVTAETFRAMSLMQDEANRDDDGEQWKSA